MTICHSTLASCDSDQPVSGCCSGLLLGKYWCSPQSFGQYITFSSILFQNQVVPSWYGIRVRFSVRPLLRSPRKCCRSAACRVHVPSPLLFLPVAAVVCCLCCLDSVRPGIWTSQTAQTRPCLHGYTWCGESAAHAQVDRAATSSVCACMRFSSVNSVGACRSARQRWRSA